MIPLPGEIEQVVPNGTCYSVVCNPTCEEVRAAMLEFPLVLFRFIEGWTSESGGVGDDLKQQICDANCGGSPVSSSSSTTE